MSAIYEPAGAARARRPVMTGLQALKTQLELADGQWHGGTMADVMLRSNPSLIYVGGVEADSEKGCRVHANRSSLADELLAAIRDAELVARARQTTAADNALTGWLRGYEAGLRDATAALAATPPAPDDAIGGT